MTVLCFLRHYILSGKYKNAISFPAKPQSDFFSAAVVSECITHHPALLPWEEWPGNSTTGSGWAHQYGSELKTDAANAFRRCSTIRNRIAGAERSDASFMFTQFLIPSQRTFYRRFVPPLMDESGSVLRGTGWRFPPVQIVFDKREIWLCGD